MSEPKRIPRTSRDEPGARHATPPVCEQYGTGDNRQQRAMSRGLDRHLFAGVHTGSHGAASAVSVRLSTGPVAARRGACAVRLIARDVHGGQSNGTALIILWTWAW